MIKFGAKAKKCWKKHYVEPISQSGTETLSKIEFYCTGCNKARTIIDWSPRTLRFVSELILKIRCHIHKDDEDWLPF